MRDFIPAGDDDGIKTALNRPDFIPDLAKLKAEKRKEQEDVDDPLKCSICGAGPFAARLGLIGHMRKHDAERGRK